VADILPVLIKWPNDLVLNRRKLGGILTETRLYGQLIHQAVVGVGINWANPVPVPGINLQEFLQSHSGIRIDSLERVAAITVAGVLMGYQRWQQIGIEKMLPDYVDLLINRGQAVDLRHRSGTIVGVTPAGNLQVQIASKQLSYPTNAALTGGSNFPETCRSELISLVPGEIDLGYDE
jgi:BirA family biotin operon repressor/biotin-[acetyl-CoA-carboxylase] ligase